MRLSWLGKVLGFVAFGLGFRFKEGSKDLDEGGVRGVGFNTVLGFEVFFGFVDQSSESTEGEGVLVKGRFVGLF